MTVEEKLKELYKVFWPFTIKEDSIILNEAKPMTQGDIDLIANLVVGRLNESNIRQRSQGDIHLHN